MARVPAGALVVMLSLLAGCASGPGGDQRQSGGGPSVIRPDRDGAPLNPPADLAATPNAEPRVEPIRNGGPNKPYVVLGQAYQPLAGDVAHRERGRASWYGTKFHGRRTASGEVYSMYGMTAAHRTLPIPSYARVRDVKSGKEVIVRINDRGPFHSERILDLSYTAALKLGLLARGSGEVEVERLTFEQIRTGQWRQPGDATWALAAQEGLPAGDAGRQASATVRTADAGPRTMTAAGTPAKPVAADGFPTTAQAMPVDADPILELASRLEGARPAGVDAASASGASQGAARAADAEAAGEQGGGSGPATGTRAVAPQRAHTPASKGFYVQLAAFTQRGGVDAFQKRVAEELSHLSPLLAVFQEGPTYRLQAGPYAARHEAQTVAQRVREALQLAPMVVERR